MTSIGEVDAVRALTDSEFPGLLDKLLSVEWPLSADRVRPLIESWGWPITWAEDDESSFVADPGYGLATKSLAEFDGFDGYLAEIVVGTSDYVQEPDDASKTELQDAFAQHVAVTEQRLGKPVRRNQGEIASVIWDLPDGARLHVARSKHSCWVDVASPEEAQERRDSGE
jgi:hypothetical protein